MSTTIGSTDGIGSFVPNDRVELPKEASILTPRAEAALIWLEKAETFRKRVAARYGVFPDCTPEIAADRRRDD